MDWLILAGFAAALLSPMFIGISFEETDTKGSVLAAACAIACLSILPLLKVLT